MTEQANLEIICRQKAGLLKKRTRPILKTVLLYLYLTKSMEHKNTTL